MPCDVDFQHLSRRSRYKTWFYTRPKWTKSWLAFKLLRFCRTFVTLNSQRHVCTTRTTFLPCPSCHILSPYCTLLTWLIPVIWRMRVIYDSSKEWVCSLYILRVSETQRIECLLGLQKATGYLIVDMEIVAFLLNIVNNFDFGQNLTVLANAVSKAIQDLSV